MVVEADGPHVGQVLQVREYDRDGLMIVDWLYLGPGRAYRLRNAYALDWATSCIIGLSDNFVKSRLGGHLPELDTLQ